MAHALQDLNNRFTLLVADDDPIIRDAIDLILRSYGYRMLFAKDGGEAISMVELERVDLAIVDLLMPESNGFDFITHCRRDKALASTPIIVMTAAAEGEHCDRAFDLGATTYVVKPLQWALFTHTIWYVLRNEARETELRALKAKLRMPTKMTAPVMG